MLFNILRKIKTNQFSDCTPAFGTVQQAWFGTNLLCSYYFRAAGAAGILYSSSLQFLKVFPFLFIMTLLLILFYPGVLLLNIQADRLAS